MSKTCLFLKAAAAACAQEEDLIRAHLKGMHVDMETIDWISAEDFPNRVDGKKFEIIYLGAHADGMGFGESNGNFYPWEALAAAICASDCMIPEGTLFLGCCRGGMKTVALKILMQCARIDYIMGPNWKSKGGDLANAFATFTRSRVIDGGEPAKAAVRATEAAGQMFTCYDRQALEGELEFLKRLQQIAWNQECISANVANLRNDLCRLEMELATISAQLGIWNSAPFAVDPFTVDQASEIGGCVPCADDLTVPS